jgi:uncharacterized membrane protein YeaQ/YmgE (transglycosylase-associated protein family)
MLGFLRKCLILHLPNYVNRDNKRLQKCTVVIPKFGDFTTRRKHMTTGLVIGAVFSPTGLIIWIVIGLVVGFLASRVMGSGGYGLIGDIIVGLVGALIGGFLANLLIPGVSFGLIGSIIISIIGACILIAILRAVRRA